MEETARYDVGPAHGYKVATTIKLTPSQAKAAGLTDKDKSKMTTTADDLAKRDRYDEAMTSQDRMRAEEAAADAEPADADADADAGNKARGNRRR